MDKEQAKGIIEKTFENSFNKEEYIKFLRNLLKSFEDKTFVLQNNNIPDIFKPYIDTLEKIGEYKDSKDNKIDLLIVKLKKKEFLERARSAQRNFIAWYLKNNSKDAVIVVFFSPGSEDWRFSLVKVDYKFEKTKVKEEFTPARRWSFLVGKNEKSHTAKSRFLPLIEDINKKPTLEDLERAFNVETVTEEFFKAYRYALNEIIIKSLNQYDILYEKKYSFAQQLLSRILFIYFLQRKGWLKWEDYKQDKSYLKNLWFRYKQEYYGTNTFYSVWLKSLFFGAFNKKFHLIHPSLPEKIKESYSTMPYLNGGLFTENELDKLGFDLPDSVFEWLFEPDEYSNRKEKGFFETFNFTIDESLPVDVEVAVDPEMLGKVYESLINEEERGGSGIFYTPRNEIDLMCRLSLVNYLHFKTEIPKEKLIDIVFNHISIDAYPNLEDLKSIYENLRNVKVVDPSVGSASFLVGMMNILVELNTALIKKLEDREENLFELKRKIIFENLYGVDVKDWAVMVGELRLWLLLIIETDEKYMDIYKKPLLPNLSFKIRQGDSLVEEIGGIFINLRGDVLKTIPESIKKKIYNLVEKKAKFFSGEISSNLKEQYEIEKLEVEIFKEILQLRINELSKKIESKEQQLRMLKDQKNLFGENALRKQKVKELEEDIKQMQDEIAKYQDVISNIDKNNKKDYFFWELDFPEVFALNSGFDIVIGNPPYVRQEKIAPPLENEKNYKPDEWRELKRQYKEKLIKAVQNVWKNVGKIDRKSDLYVYFYYMSLSLLNNGGILCFINSNSWLDVGYGAGLQEFLLKQMKPLYIIDNIAKRSFKQADVNTVIVLIQKPQTKPDDFTVKFIAFKKPFEEAISPEILKEIEKADKPIFDYPVYRIYPKTKTELLEEGVEYPDDTELDLKQNPEQLPYIGNKWGGKYLRAPEIYFKILEKGKDKLVRLGDIAEVRRGFTTGANEFFYLKPVGMTVKEVVETAERNPQALIRVKNSAGWEGEIEAEFLKPVIVEYENLNSIIIEPDCLLFTFPEKNYKNLDYKAVEYIKWGEKYKTKGRQKQKSGIPLPKIQSLINKKYWYSFKPSDELISNIFWQKRIGERFCLFYCENHAFTDQKFYPLTNISADIFDLLLNVNSTIQRLFLEVIGKPYTGAYTLVEISVDDLKRLVILNYSFKYKSLIKELIKRKKFLSIFTELGFDPNRPIREQEPNPLPDRKELDDIVFDALGLTEEERKEVYWAVAELVKARLDKAKSV